MKIITLIIFYCLLTITTQGAGEIRSFTNCPAAFAVIREIDGDVWYVTGEVFEAWGTAARTAADYDIALTSETGGMFTGTFDTNISAGYYYIITHDDADSTPADTDSAVWVDYGYWTGSVWTSGADASDIDTIAIDVAGLDGDAMRGTDGANTIVPDAAGTAAALHAISDALIADVNDNIESYIGDVPTTEEIRIEMDSNSVDFNTIIDDTNEIQTDWTNGGRLDVIIDAIKAMTDLITILDTDVDTAVDANNFIMSDGIDVNDVFDYCLIRVTDADDGHSEVRWVRNYDITDGKEIWVDRHFGFTPAAGDLVYIMGTSYGGWLRRIIPYIPNPPDVFDFRISAGGSLTLNAEDEDP